MNPFLYDTVAQPLHASRALVVAQPFSASDSVNPTDGNSRQKRRLVSHRAGMMALMTVAGLGSFSAQALDVNRASQTELQSIKGVGPRTAQIIVQERQRAGHFESLEDLSERVRGIGMKRLQAMQQAGLGVGLRSHLSETVSGDQETGINSESQRRARQAGVRSHDSRRKPAARVSPVVTEVVTAQAVAPLRSGANITSPQATVEQLPVSLREASVNRAD